MFCCSVNCAVLDWTGRQDLMIMGITAVGPRRKIFQAIQELKRGSSGGRREPQTAPAGLSPAMANTIPPAESTSRVPQANGEESNNVITNYFPLPPDSGRRPLHETSATDTTRRTGVVKSRTPKRPRSSGYENMRGIPEWMCIPGTPFRVVSVSSIPSQCHVQLRTCETIAHLWTNCNFLPAQVERSRVVLL